MENKIQQLTEKLYEEGLQKGKAESERIISQAKAEADKIILQAKAQAAEIIDQAGKRDEEMKTAAMKEVELAARRVIAQSKESVKNLLADATVATEVNAAFRDDQFVAGLIATIVENWSRQNPDAAVSIVVPKDKETVFSDFIAKKVAAVLASAPEVKPDEKLSEGFRITPSQGKYYISFTDEQFDNFFQTYIRPKVSEIIFGK